MTLSNWKARRAGGRITVVGKNEQGEDAKIVGVDYVEPAAGGGCKAVDKDNRVHTLLPL
jgi:hypothetical protein